MTDLKLGTDRDLYYDGNLHTVDDYEEALQSLEIAFRTGLGEWLYDTDEGTAWRGLIRTKNPNWTAIEAEIRRVAEARIGITVLRDIKLDFVPLTRTLTITADTIYGEVKVTTLV